VTNFISVKLMPPLAVFMVLLASFLYLTAAGNPAKVVSARQVLVFTVIGAGILLLAPALVALTIDIFGGTTSAISQCDRQIATATFLATLTNIINWFSWLLAILSVAVGLYAGFLYMTSSGDPQKVVTANRVLVYAVVGVVVAILAFSVISIVEGFIL